MRRLGRFARRCNNLMAQKGKIASFQGFVLSFPANFRALYFYFNDLEMSETSLITLVVINGIAMAWVMLPSTIKITAPKLSIEIID